MGIVIGWGNLNGVVSSNIYRGADKPRFLPGHGTVLAYLILFLLGGTLVQYFGLRAENAKRRRGGLDGVLAQKGLQEGDGAEIVRVLGDKRPGFYYTL